MAEDLRAKHYLVNYLHKKTRNMNRGVFCFWLMAVVGSWLFLAHGCLLRSNATSRLCGPHARVIAI